MKVFLTGATGFVGRNFLDWLVRHEPDTQIDCLVRDPQKAQAQWQNMPQNINKRINWIAGDLLQPETYRSQLKQAERVVHAAALVSLRNGPEFYRMNTYATQNLLNALSGSDKLQRLVFVGSISAIDRPMDQPAIGPLTEESPPHPNTDYGKSKLMAEELVVKSGLPFAILRPAYIYGPFPRINSSMDRLIHHMTAGKSYTRFPFPGRASEVYAEDLAEMIWLATHHPNVENESFFVSNPTPVRVADAYAALAKAVGAEFKPLDLSDAELARYRSLWYRQQPDNLLLRILFEDFFACAPDKWYRLTGYRPTFGFKEGLAKTAHWYRQQGML